jgi:tetratricopeptide (TPR) repeat protein
LANILRHSDAGRSLDICQHTLRHIGEIKDNSSFRRFEARTLSISAYALQRLGRSAEARQAVDEALERLRQLKDYPAEKIKPGSEAYAALSALADYEAGEGHVHDAIEIYEKLLGQILAWGPKLQTNLADAVNVSRVYSELELLYQGGNEPELASALAARRFELWRQWDAKLPHNKFIRRQLEVTSGRPFVQAQ